MGCLQSQPVVGNGNFTPFSNVAPTAKPPPNVNEKPAPIVNNESHRGDGARHSQKVLMYQSEKKQGAPFDTGNNQQSQDSPQYSTLPKDFGSSEKNISKLSTIDDSNLRPSPKVLMCQCNKKLRVSLDLEHRVQSQDIPKSQLEPPYPGVTIREPIGLEQRQCLKDSPQYLTQSEDSSTEIVSSAHERSWKPMASRQYLTQSEAFGIEIPPVILDQRLQSKASPENLTKTEDHDSYEEDTAVFRRVGVWDSIFECEVKFLERAAYNLVEYSSELIDEEVEHYVDDYIEETFGEGFATVQHKLHFVRNVLYLFRAYLAPEGIPTGASSTLYSTRKMPASVLKVWWEDYVEEMSGRYQAMLDDNGVKQLVNLFFRHYSCPAEISTELKPAITEKINILFKKEISEVTENVLSVFNSNIRPESGEEDQQDFLVGYFHRSFLVTMLNVLNGTIRFVRQYPAMVNLLKEVEEKWHSDIESHQHHDHHWDQGSFSHHHHDHYATSQHHRRRSSTFVGWEHHDRFDTRRDSLHASYWKPLATRRDSHLSGAWKPMTPTRLTSRRFSHLYTSPKGAPRRESQLFSASKPIGYIGRERDHHSGISAKSPKSHVARLLPLNEHPQYEQKLTISTPIHTRAVSMDTGANAVSLHRGVVQYPPKSILKAQPGGTNSSITVRFADTGSRTPSDQPTSILPPMSRDGDMIKLLRSLSTLHPKKPVLHQAWTVAEKSYGVSDSACNGKENVLGIQKGCSKVDDTMGEDDSDGSSASPASSLLDETLDLELSIPLRKNRPESDQRTSKAQSNPPPSSERKVVRNSIKGHAMQFAAFGTVEIGV